MDLIFNPIFDFVVICLIIGLIYYLLRRLDFKNKDKYPRKFNGRFDAIDIPGYGEYFCKRYWFWQVEKRKFLEQQFQEYQFQNNLSGAIYSRRAVKRGRGHVGEKGKNIFLRELYIRV